MNPRITGTSVYRTACERPEGKVSSHTFLEIFTAYANTCEVATGSSPLHAIFLAMASSSLTNSNVSKLQREADDFEDGGIQGLSLSAIAGEFGIGKTTVTDIKKAGEKIMKFSAC